MRILIVKTSSLGDIIHAFPALSYLRAKFPDDQIDWVVEEKFKRLVEAHPYVHKVWTIDSKRWRKKPWRSICPGLKAERYDVVFDLQGNIKSGLVTCAARATEKVGFGRKTVPEWPNVLFTSKRYNPPAGKNIREDYLYIVQTHFGDTAPFIDEGVVLEGEDPPLDGTNHVLVCPGSAWPSKQITTEAMIELCGKTGGPFLWAWGNEAEHEIAKQLHSAFPDNSTILPKLSLPTLQRLMSQVRLVIAMDSLPLHLCGTTSTPSFSVFGPSSMEKYKPLGEQHTAVQGSCPYGVTFSKRCPRLRTCPDSPCTKAIGEEARFSVFGPCDPKLPATPLEGNDCFL